MVKTEIALFAKRVKIEMMAIEQKLALLESMAEDDTINDCVSTAVDVLQSLRNDAEKIDELGAAPWSMLYDLEYSKKQGNEVEADG